MGRCAGWWARTGGAVGVVLVLAGCGGGGGGGGSPLFSVPEVDAPPLVSVAPVGDGGQGGAGQGGGLGDTAEQLGFTLPGVWRGASVDLAGNPTVIDVSILESGTFTQSENGPLGLFYLAGGWTVVGDGLLRLTIDEYFPTEFCGPLGCTPNLVAPAYTVQYRFLGSDQLETTDASGRTVRFQRVA